MISKKFFKSSFIYTVVGALPMLAGFILLPFYTGDILSEKNYGYLTLHLVFGLLFQSVFVFCLDNFIGPVIIESREDKTLLKNKLAAINYYSLVFGGIFILTLVLAGPFIFRYSFQGQSPLQFYPFIFMTVITSFFNAYFKQYCNHLIYSDEPYRYLVANLVNFVTTIGISITALYYFGDSIAGPLTGRLLSGVIIFVLAFIFMNKHYGAKSDPVFLKEIIKFCAPFAGFYILNWTFNNGDRFFIEKMLSTELVGLFDFGIKCTLGIEVLFSGMNNSIYPKIYVLIAEKASPEKLKVHINKYASGYLITIILATVFTLCTVPFAIILFIKKVFYHKALAFLAILTTAQILKVLYNIYLAPLLFYKRTDLIARSFIYATFVQLLLTYVLIYFFGFNGIIVAYILSKPFQVLFIFMESNKLIKLPINGVKQMLLPFIIGAVVFALQLIIKDNNALYYNPLVGVIIFIITLFFYRNEVIPFTEDLLRKLKVS